MFPLVRTGSDGDFEIISRRERRLAKQTSTPQRVAIYCRISKDRDGEEAGVQRQEQDCRDLAAHRRWVLATRPDGREAVFVDNDMGASEHSKVKVRPEYEELLAGIELGLYDAVVYYSNSRLTRRPKEWLRIIELVNKYDVQLASVRSGTYDLTTADGRAVAMTVAIWDAAEADRISERVRRSLEEAADQGRPHMGGDGRPFGFAADRVTHDPLEVDLIRRAARHVIAGATTGAIARMWNEMGVPTAGKAERWHKNTVRGILTAPRTAGLRSHRKEVVGQAKWEPILDRPTWDAVRAALARSEAKPKGFNQRKYRLSGLVHCECGTRMVTGPNSQKKPAFKCLRERGGCGATRLMAGIETWVIDAVEEYIRTRGHDSTRELDPVEDGAADQIATLEAKIKNTQERMINGELEDEDGYPLIQGYRAKIKTLRVRQAQAVATEVNAVGGLQEQLDLLHGEDPAMARDVISQYISGVTIKRGQPTGPAPLDTTLIVINFHGH